MQSAEPMSREALTILQTSKLRRLLERAYATGAALSAQASTPPA
jgi:hypothetical protein